VPTSDVITLPLGLEGLEVVGQEVSPDGSLVVKVQYSRASVVCPKCHRPTNKLHDRRLQRKRDLPLREQAVILRLIRRRFRCVRCGVLSANCRWRPLVFSEPQEGFGRGPKGRSRRTTRRLREQLAREARVQTVKRVAECFGVGERFVRECLRDWAQPIIAAEVPPGYTPRTLSVDEYSLRRGRRYETLVCDPGKRQVLARLPGRDGSALQEWLEERSDPWAVEAAVSDMSLTYREVIELCLPKAKVVADRFHVVRRVGKALDQVRLRLQRARGQEHEGELYELRHVLLTDRAKWSVEERRRVRQLFRELPELHQAWLLREQFRRWYESRDRELAEKLLAKWERQVQASGIAEFVKLSAGASSMLVEWREEILNYFDVRLTNGFVEGKNNRTKAIERQAYGYRNPANLRLRILLPKLE